MNENPNQESSLKIIQRKFLAKLQDNLGGFRKFLEKVTSEKYSSEECTEIRGIIHQLAGGGKTFGFDDVSKHASVIQTQLDNIIANKKGSKTIDILKSEFNQKNSSTFRLGFSSMRLCKIMKMNTYIRDTIKHCCYIT